jgi:hypothetical protein
LRARHPGVVLIAEAYWDLEWSLQQQGFDFCYDKRLYDRLTALDVEGIRGHLHADDTYQAGLLRFLENHDEPRAADRLPAEAIEAAAVVLATLPGATLWHEGQAEGRRVHTSVFLRREPDELVDEDRAVWHQELRVAATSVRDGTWQLLDVHGWPDNDTCRSLLAWSWTARDGPRHLVVVNLSPTPAQGRVPLPWPDLAGGPVAFTDLLRDEAFYRDGDELASEGLFVSLDPWHHHVLAVDW